MVKDQIRSLTTGSILRNLIRFSIPMVLSNVLQVSYNIIDMLIIGQTVGQNGLIAVANGSDILFLFTVLCMGFSQAGQVVVAHAVGAGESREFQRAVLNLQVALGAAAVVMCFIGFLSLDFVLSLLRTPSSAINDAKSFSKVGFCSLFFVFGFNGISAVLRGMGNSKTPFYVVGTAVFVNLCLDLLLIRVFGWGVQGAALATLISQAFAFIGSLVLLLRSQPMMLTAWRRVRTQLDAQVLWTLLKLGVPMALQTGAVNISKLFVSSWVNSFGTSASAVTSIGTRIAMVASIVTTALGSAVTSMVGQSLGARRVDRIPKIIGACLLVGCAFNLVLAFGLISFHDQIFQCFRLTATALSLVSSYMWVLSLSFMAFALRTPLTGFINGSGNGRLNLLVALLDAIVVRVGMSFLLGHIFRLGLVGFWLGDSIASFIPFLIGTSYYFFGKWQSTRILMVQKPYGTKH